MLTTKPPAIEPVDGADRMKAFVSYGDPIGAKNLCMMGILKLMPDLKLEVLESKQIELTAGVLCHVITGDGTGHALPEIRTSGNQKFKAQLESYHSDAHVRVALEAQFKELWNRVEDGLPDDDIEVLVYREKSESMFLAHHEDGAWITDSGDEFSGVTHWMDVIPPNSIVNHQS